MSLAEYFQTTEGIGVLATCDSDGNVDAAVYARPYVIDENTIAFSMLERTTFANIQSNPKAAYLFVEQGKVYHGKRLYLTKISEESDPAKIEAIKAQRPTTHKGSVQTEKHLVYFAIGRIRPLVGG